MKLLSHPHIIHVHDVTENRDDISIVMEFAAGGELFDYIVARGMLKEKESRLFFRQIISAVTYCHQNSVIHRDLKPEVFVVVTILEYATRLKQEHQDH